MKVVNCLLSETLYRSRSRKFVLCNRVRELRLAQGLTQTDLAHKCFVSRNTISAIEVGLFSPTAYLSGLICRALNVSWEECFYYI